MEGGRCFASSGSSGTVRGVPRRCIFTAADYVLDFVHAGHFDRIFDIVYDYVSARLARTWSSPSCSSSSSPSSSSAAASSGSSGLAPDRPGLPRRFVQHHLVAIVAVHFYPFVYSSNCGLHRHLLPRRSSAPATVVEAFSAGPSDNGVLVVHSPSHVRSWQHRCVPSSPMHSRVWQTRGCVARWRVCVDCGIDSLFDCLDASPSSSPASSPLRLHHGASSCARGFLCGSLPSATSTAHHRPRLPYARLPRPRLLAPVRLLRHRHKGLPSA